MPSIRQEPRPLTRFDVPFPSFPFTPCWLRAPQEAEARKAEAPPTPSVSNEAVKEVLGTVARVAATQIVKTLL